ncbi:MAG: FMN-binding protein [Acidobacteriota bacterium]|nr:FMN-binding protein [Acidobacteriota bacterium]
MNSVPPPAPPQPPGFRMVRLLGAVSLVCGMLIVGTNLATSSRIRHNQEIIMRNSVAELLPGIQKQIVYGVEPSGDLRILPGIEIEGKRLIAGYDAGGKFLGVVIETSDRGYADVISAMYAYSPEKKEIVGFKVVDMRETPGLGDRIRSDPEFTKNFEALDATHPITVVKHGTKKHPWEIDAISGATISSRAVGRMLEKSVEDMTPVVLKNLERIERGD